MYFCGLTIFEGYQFENPHFSLLGMVLKLGLCSKTPLPLCHCLAGSCLVSQGNILHTRTHNKVKFHREVPLEIRWELPVKIHWESDSALGNTAGEVTIRWKMPLNIYWKMPLKIHDDF